MENNYPIFCVFIKTTSWRGNKAPQTCSWLIFYFFLTIASKIINITDGDLINC